MHKVGATRPAEADAPVAELEAPFGHTGSDMASHHARPADRKRPAKLAATKRIGNAQRPCLDQHIPCTLKKVQ